MTLIIPPLKHLHAPSLYKPLILLQIIAQAITRKLAMHCIKVLFQIQTLSQTYL